jgi:hypothetical protein
MEGNVGCNIERRNEVELLEDEGNLMAPIVCPLDIVQSRDVPTVDVDRPCIRLVESPDQVKKGTLPATGFAGQRNALTAMQLKVNALEHSDWTFGTWV